jgi:hypothetical protein
LGRSSVWLTQRRIKDDIVNKGGQITHEYNLIKGFA